MHKIIMPKLGLTMEEGTLVRWLKREGDQVEKGEILFEVETDKALNEVEAPHSGTLARILLHEGETVAVLEVIAFLLEAGEQPPDEWPQVEGAALQVELEAGQVDLTLRISPVAQRLARERGVDLAKVVGSGQGGKIIKEDILRAAAKVKTTPAKRSRRIAASPRARRLAQEKGISLEMVQGSGPQGRITEQDVLESLAATDIFIPSKMKQITATRMQESFTTTPHFYLKIEVDASQLVAWRERLLPEVEAAVGERLTYTDLLISLTAQALMNHPLLNASWVNQSIRMHADVNIAVATAVEDGLTIPVIQHADRKSITQIASERSQLAKKAASGKLGLEHLEGATFTLSNLGMFGIDEFTAIINPPHSAILAVGRIAERVVAHEGKAEVRQTLILVLSIDHRVLDGAQASRFLVDLKRLIEEPGNVLEAASKG